VLGFFDLLLVGGHGLARAAVGHGDFLGTQAEGRARGVDRGIAAAADRHVLAHRHGSAEIAGPQEAQGVGNPFRVLAGVEADPRANGGKRVPLAVQAQRFRIAILRHQRDVAGDVHVGRASALARGMDQRRANAGAAPLVADVLHVFVAEVADRREHGVGGRLPPSPHSEVSLIVSPSSTSRSTSASEPRPSQMRLTISSIRLVPTRQGTEVASVDMVVWLSNLGCSIRGTGRASRLSLPRLGSGRMARQLRRSLRSSSGLADRRGQTTRRGPAGDYPSMAAIQLRDRKGRV